VDDVDVANRFFTVLALVADAAIVVLALGLLVRPLRARVARAVGPVAVPLALVVATVATLGSLYYSEIADFTPCLLCWYQRVCMYPLVAISTVALLIRDRRASIYLWPLALCGLGTAAYHNLLYYHLIPESITPCTAGVSCTDRQIEWLGFITIPLLSLSAFAIIVGCLLWFGARMKGNAVADQ
jgi:disulfide bond formation protein DsbB